MSAGMADTDTEAAREPAWRQRAVSRRLDAARSRAEGRIQRFIDAAFSLIDEKGTTDFTIQEVLERSKQSLRAFYQYFDGKDELLLALLEEFVIEAVDDLGSVVAAETDPVERLRVAAVRLHAWCDPSDVPRVKSSHNRRPISEFAVQLSINHPVPVAEAMAPIIDLLVGLVDAAVEAGSLRVADPQRAAVLIGQTMMQNWVTNRAVDPRRWITADEAWAFCLHGLSA